MTNDQHRQRVRDVVIQPRIGLPALLNVAWLAACAMPQAPEATTPPVSAVTPTVTLPPADAPDPTDAPRPADTPTPIASLTWDALRNAGYPNEWPSEGIAQLEDGEYRFLCPSSNLTLHQSTDYRQRGNSYDRLDH